MIGSAVKYTRTIERERFFKRDESDVVVELHGRPEFAVHHNVRVASDLALGRKVGR
jgi:hypothetical protein